MTSAAGRCLDEQELVRLAAGLIPMLEADPLFWHVERCEGCRVLLQEAGIALNTVQQFGDSLASFRVGERIAERYEVRRFLAKGGMGEVYEVFDTELHERAALKTIRAELSDDPLVVARFKQEIRIARKVVHPNVCRVFDLGVASTQSGGPLYFHTMEFVDGRALSDFCRESNRVAFVLAVARQVASGLAAIHSHGIVHRDIKPDNVLVSGETLGPMRCVIADFGVARSRDRHSGLATTASGVRLGTPGYMAPELLLGARGTAASDLFSLGVLLYELLCGSHPFRSGPQLGMAPTPEASSRVLDSMPAEVPIALGELIVACLAHDPALRAQNGAELLRGLNRIRASVPPSAAQRF